MHILHKGLWHTYIMVELNKLAPTTILFEQEIGIQQGSLDEVDTQLPVPFQCLSSCIIAMDHLEA